jgi:hypothetical protein
MALRGGFNISVSAGQLYPGEVSYDDIVKTQEALKSLALEYPKAAVRAVNASMTGVKTDMKKILRTDYNYKATTLESRIRIVKAKVNAFRGMIESKGKSVPLTDIAGTRQLKAGVKAKIRKDGSGDVIPSAFIQTVGSGKKVVLRRPMIPPKMRGGKRYGRYGDPGTGGLVTVNPASKGRGSARLEWFETMHPEFLYNTKENWQRISLSVKERLDKNIQRETDAEIRRLKGKW